MFKLELLAEAAVTLTSNWLSELVLLLNSLVKLVACSATECANLQLRLDFGSTRHCSLDRHDPTETDRLQVSNLMQVGHVVDTALIPLSVSDLVTLVGKELSQTLAKVGLEANVLALESVHKAFVLPVVACHVSVVDVHRASFLVEQLCGALNIVEHLVICFIILGGSVGFVVRIVLAQCEAMRKKSKDLNSGKISEKCAPKYFTLSRFQTET